MVYSATSCSEGQLEVVQELHCEAPPEISTESSSSTSTSLESYDLDKTIDAWDLIGSLTSEISSSVMAKQASMVSERFREAEASTRPKKRRKMETTNARTETTVDQPIVISDEESQASSTEGAFSDGVEAFSEDLATQIDRMGRMSKLIMKIEHCQRQLRADMLAMGTDNDL
jgi:hypothetical protein